jgi:hypothetical protein
MKLISKLPNGRFGVNKAAVIAKLIKAQNARKKAAIDGLGVLQVSPREIQQEAMEMTRYSAEHFLNTSEE